MKRKYTYAVIPHVLRMVQLRRAGVSCTAVAIVCNVDFGTDYTAAQVRRWTRVQTGGERFPRGRGQVSKDTGANLEGVAA